MGVFTTRSPAIAATFYGRTQRLMVPTHIADPLIPLVGVKVLGHSILSELNLSYKREITSQPLIATQQSEAVLE